MNVSKIVLLGAGASVDAGVPASTSMTQRMAERLDTSDTADLYQALFVLVGGLQMGSVWGSQKISWAIDIERVMNAAQLLENRFDAELAPFVGTWHPVLDELETRVIHKTLARMPAFDGGSIPMVRSASDLERVASNIIGKFSDAIRAVASALVRRPDGSLFGVLRQHLTRNLINLSWINTGEKVDYLSPLVHAAAATPFAIATLNYDNSIELSASRSAIAVDNGLDQWNRSGSFVDTQVASSDKRIRLIKLHGSVDWWWHIAQPISIFAPNADRAVIRVVGKQEMEQAITGQPHFSRPTPALIFGGKNKLTARGPFLDLLFWFR